jgi:hypothetical protein
LSGADEVGLGKRRGSWWKTLRRDPSIVSRNSMMYVK